MKRVAIGKIIKRLEGELTAVHPLQLMKKRLIYRSIAQMRILQAKLDHLAGWHNIFILSDNTIVIRQTIVRTQETFWYKFYQTELTVIENPTELENIYVESYTSMD